MLYTVDVPSRDNLAGRTSDLSRKKKKWNILSFFQKYTSSKNLTAWKNINKYIFLFEDKKKQGWIGKEKTCEKTDDAVSE